MSQSHDLFLFAIESVQCVLKVLREVFELCAHKPAVKSSHTFSRAQ